MHWSPPRRRLPFLPTTSASSRPYVALVSRIDGYKNHIGAATTRGHGEEWQPPPRTTYSDLYPSVSSTLDPAPGAAIFPNYLGGEAALYDSGNPHPGL